MISSENFESGIWSGGSGWAQSWTHSGASSVISTASPHGGSEHLRLRSSDGYAARPINLQGFSNVHLHFWAKVDSFEGTDSANILVSSNGVSWTVVKTFTAADSDNAYHSYDIDLSGFTTSSQFWIAFDAEMSASGDLLYLDDIQIAGQQ